MNQDTEQIRKYRVEHDHACDRLLKGTLTATAVAAIFSIILASAFLGFLYRGLTPYSIFSISSILSFFLLTLFGVHRQRPSLGTRDDSSKHELDRLRNEHSPLLFALANDRAMRELEDFQERVVGYRNIFPLLGLFLTATLLAISAQVQIGDELSTTQMVKLLNLAPQAFVPTVCGLGALLLHIAHGNVIARRYKHLFKELFQRFAPPLAHGNPELVSLSEAIRSFVSTAEGTLKALNTTAEEIAEIRSNFSSFNENFQEQFKEQWEQLIKQVVAETLGKFSSALENFEDNSKTFQDATANFVKKTDQTLNLLDESIKNQRNRLETVASSALKEWESTFPRLVNDIANRTHASLKEELKLFRQSLADGLQSQLKETERRLQDDWKRNLEKTAHTIRELSGSLDGFNGQLNNVGATLDGAGEQWERVIPLMRQRVGEFAQSLAVLEQNLTATGIRSDEAGSEMGVLADALSEASVQTRTLSGAVSGVDKDLRQLSTIRGILRSGPPRS